MSTVTTMGWDVIGYPADPIPDDPAVIAEQVQHLRNAAATIHSIDKSP